MKNKKLSFEEWFDAIFLENEILMKAYDSLRYTTPDAPDNFARGLYEKTYLNK